MGVASTVKLNFPTIRRLDEAAKTALVQTAEAIHTDLVQSETVPRKTGALQNEKTFVSAENVNQGSVELVFEGPYARRLYFHPEYNFHQEPWELYNKDGIKVDEGDGNPHAQGEWLKTYVDGDKRHFAEKAFAKLYQQSAGT